MSDENKIEEEIIETDKEVQDEVQELVSEVEEESKALTPQPAKMKKHHEAKKLVEEAKSIVKASESELQDCRLLLEDDLKEYDAAKKALKVGGYNAAKDLLSELGHGTFAHDEEEDVVFEAKDDVKPIVLKDVRSGRFTGM
ncbi:MAG TPA: hypothetical protein ENK68_04905, partial [Epsilonproteobacteria bacterium]|nr:hypothetical protein [Campylobacterota bacterium]